MKKALIYIAVLVTIFGWAFTFVNYQQKNMDQSYEKTGMVIDGQDIYYKKSAEIISCDVEFYANIKKIFEESVNIDSILEYPLTSSLYVEGYKLSTDTEGCTGYSNYYVRIKPFVNTSLLPLFLQKSEYRTLLSYSYSVDIPVSEFEEVFKEDVIKLPISGYLIDEDLYLSVISEQKANEVIEVVNRFRVTNSYEEISRIVTWTDIIPFLEEDTIDFFDIYHNDGVVGVSRSDSSFMYFLAIKFPHGCQFESEIEEGERASCYVK